MQPPSFAVDTVGRVATATIALILGFPSHYQAEELGIDNRGQQGKWQTLPAFFAQEGFGFAKLEQEEFGSEKLTKDVGKHLVASVAINQVKGSLMIDTGTPSTVIARSSARQFGLIEQKTSHRVAGSLGSSASEFLGRSKLNTLAIGNCLLHDLPVAITSLPHLDGVLGSEDMHRIGGVIDCAEQTLYFAAHGPATGTSEKLAARLASKGFTRIPMILTPQHHFEVTCSINGLPCNIMVDTGSLLTSFDKNIGIKARVAMKPTSLTEKTAGGGTAQVDSGRVKELAIGDFKITDTNASFVDYTKVGRPSTCYLGIEQLARYSAIIDVGGMSLYLHDLDNKMREATPTPSATPKPGYRFIVDKGAVTLRVVESSAVVCTSTIDRLGVVAPTQDKLRHLALDVTAACVAGKGEREKSRVDPGTAVTTLEEADKAKAEKEGTVAVTSTIERGVVFFMYSDTYTKGHYEALISWGGILRE